MARVKGLLQVTGSMKGVSMYTMRGSDEVIIRTKGGPSKQTIKTSESCKTLRENGREWSGCTKAASSLRRGLEVITRLADYNTMGGMNALCKKIQNLDVTHPKGQRNVYMRAYRQQIAGFNFNRTNPFDRVIRLNPAWEIDRATASGTLTMPEFIPDEHLAAPNKLPLMRFVIVLGVCTDVVYDEHIQDYKPANDLVQGYHREACSDWFPVKRSMPEQTINVQMTNIAQYLTDSDTLVLAVGVEFGTVGADGNGEAVKWTGSAKIIGAL